MSFLAHNILLPTHIEYLLVNNRFIILERSSGVSQFFNSADEVEIGQDIRESFPELVGCETILNAIFAGQQQNFQLTRIHRPLNTNKNIYINLYVSFYQKEIYSENYLLVFVEDVTESTSIEQVLVQKNNENILLLDDLKSSQNYIQKIVTSMADALIVTTIKGNIKTINKKNRRIIWL